VDTNRDTQTGKDTSTPTNDASGAPPAASAWTAASAQNGRGTKQNQSIETSPACCTAPAPRVAVTLAGGRASKLRVDEAPHAHRVVAVALAGGRASKRHRPDFTSSFWSERRGKTLGKTGRKRTVTAVHARTNSKALERRFSWSVASMPGWTWCPRQDSNLRHPL
jgi:hypothetical protein